MTKITFLKISSYCLYEVIDCYIRTHFEKNGSNFYSKLGPYNFVQVKKYIRLSHHLHEGLSTFFKIEDIKRNPPIYIFEFSSLHKDIFFFLKNVNRINKNKLNQFLAIVKNSSPNKKKLSSIGKKNLKIFLREDYKVYNYLIKRKSKINLKFINKI